MKSRTSRSIFRALEALEPRRHLAATPTNDEQYMLELINRARANPTAEAARYGVDLNEGLSAGTISSAAKQPLAFNEDLITSARNHSLWMLTNQTFTHYEGNTDPGTRMSNAGYTFSGSYGWGENIAYRGSFGTIDTDSLTAQEHEDLFVDSSEPGRGHRVNIEDPSFKEIGVGIAAGNFDSFDALMTTEDFAYSATASFLTGVAYTDAITPDNFYEPGEGLGNIVITATNAATDAVFSTTTWSSGGYTLALPAGTYAVTAVGAGLGSKSDGDVTIGSQNVEADFTPASSTVSSGGSTTATGSGGTTTPVIPQPVISQPVTTQPVTSPIAVLTASTVTKSGATCSFTITYTGSVAIDASTFDKHDIAVTGPDGYRGSATFVSSTSTAGGKVRKVTYRLAAPSKKWTKLNDGVYHVYIRPNQVSDVNGNMVDAALLGYFKIKI